jgi:hypothetical protein
VAGRSRSPDELGGRKNKEAARGEINIKMAI